MQNEGKICEILNKIIQVLSEINKRILNNIIMGSADAYYSIIELLPC